VRLAAYGEAARAEAHSPAELRNLLTALTRPDAVEWLDGPADACERPPGPFFGSVAFDPERPLGAGWEGFAPARWALPRIAVFSTSAAASRPGGATWDGITAGGGHSIAAFGDDPARDLDRALGESSGSSAAAALPRSRAAAVNGARTAWSGLVAAALSRIERGDLHKVVLARTVEVQGESAFAEEDLLAALEARHPTCRAFLLRGDDGSSFAGATPESLCRLDGRDLCTDALAGSARLLESEALLRRSKDLREHAWVVEHVVGALRSISERVEAAEGPRIRRLADVAHLYTPIHARLREGQGLADVVLALHPTPAVGGVPSRAALRFIAEEEKIGRGLYAGLVGVCGPGRADLAVALRCALLRGPAARLYVGAGIVAGSTAEGEWAETELKARALLSALGVTD
jgi:isochorismate synthase